jgi:hypothetical protein
MKTQRTMNATELYEIRVAGHLSERWAAWYEGLSLRHEPGGETVLSDRLDQAALHGNCMRICDLGLKLVSVRRIGSAVSASSGSSRDI